MNIVRIRLAGSRQDVADAADIIQRAFPVIEESRDYRDDGSQRRMRKPSDGVRRYITIAVARNPRTKQR